MPLQPSPATGGSTPACPAAPRQVSIGDMAKAVRRRKMLEDVIAGGEGRQRLAQEYDAHM